MNPKVSVVVVNWNTRELLEDCLASVFQSSPGLDMEVIVVDNASHDGSAEMVAAKYPDVMLLSNSDNVGFARANNQAFAVARGRYLLMLNSDCIVRHAAFEVLIDYMDAHPEAGACGPMLLNADGTLQPSWAAAPSVWSEARYFHDRRVGGKDYSLLCPDGLGKIEPFGVGWCGGACLVVRREAAEKVGVLDKGYFMYCEETDWCMRIRAAGWEVVFVPQARVVHLGGGSSRATPLATRLRMERSRLRLLWKFGGWTRALLPGLAVLILARVMAGMVVKGVRR